MKPLILQSFFSLLITSVIFAQNQNIELTFTAKYYDNHIPLDSVLIENLSQGGDTMLYAPDTVLLLGIATGIENLPETTNNLRLLQNSPNPFMNETSVMVFVPKQQHIKCIVTDAMGRKLYSFEKVMGAGQHTLLFQPGKEKLYFLSVTCGEHTQTIKMIHTGNSKNSVCTLTLLSFDETNVNYKLKPVLNGFTFSPGDSLRYTGYATNQYTIPGSFVTVDTPTGDETYIFHIIEGLPCQETPLVNYENKLYQTVEIGEQCWLKENLNIGAMINGGPNQTNNGVIEKYCYNNDEGNCEQYGGLYQWNEMMQYSTEPGAQGICPENWHIPTDEDWCILKQYVDISVDCQEIGWSGVDAGIKMKSAMGWASGSSGTNSCGFSALPAGNRTVPNTFSGIDKLGFFWSSDQKLTDYAWFLRLSYEYDEVYRSYNSLPFGFSVRCLK